MNAKLKQKFGADNIIAAAMNYQVYFDRKVLADSKLELDDVRDYVMTELKKEPSVLYVLSTDEIWESSIPEPIKSRVINGYNWKRSGDIQIISKDGYLSAYSKKGQHTVYGTLMIHIFLYSLWGGVSNRESPISHTI